MRPGFDNINLDLIFSVPGADPESWYHSLEAVVDLRPEHVSTYSLTIESETPFEARVDAGKLQLRSEDESAEEYEQAMQVLGAAGYEHYENLELLSAPVIDATTTGRAGVAVNTWVWVFPRTASRTVVAVGTIAI